jgi:hypothetical protein
VNRIANTRIASSSHLQAFWQEKGQYEKAGKNVVSMSGLR